MATIPVPMVQIVCMLDPNNPTSLLVFGLGSDSLVYFWTAATQTWAVYT